MEVCRMAEYRDPKHINPNKEYQISELVRFIREKVYGIDVREALALGLQKAYDDASKNGNANMEVLRARGVFNVLADRLNDSDGRLAQRVTQSDFDSWIATLLDGGPSIFYETLAALEADYPNGAAGIALVRESDPARIYVWDGTKWADYGPYQGIELKNNSVRPETTTFIRRTKNLYHGNLIEGLIDGTHTGVGGYLRTPSNGYGKVCIIEIEPNQSYTITPYGGDRNRYAVFNEYPKINDKSDVYLFSSDGNKVPFTFTNNSQGRYLVLYLSSIGDNVPCQVEEGSISTNYLPYYHFESGYIADINGNKINDRSLDMEKMRFSKISPKNLYHGDLTLGFITGSNTNVGGVFSLGDTYPNSHVTIIEIQPNKTYTITPYGGDRNRYAVFSEYPVLNMSANRYLFSKDGDRSPFTFTNDGQGKYLMLFLSSTGEDVICQVEEGRESTDYEPYIYIPVTKPIDKDEVRFIKRSEKNLYHGNLRLGVIDGSYTAVGGFLRTPSNGLGKVCIINIDPGETYTITPYGGDRRRYAVFNDYPEIDVKSDVYLFANDSSNGRFTFTNGANGKYLVLYLSSVGEDVLCQVEKGTESTEYEGYYYIEPALVGGKSATRKESKVRTMEKYNISKTLELGYIAPPQESVAAGDPFNLWEAKHGDIYALYDELTESRPNYISKHFIGYEDYGLPMYYYKFTPPRAESFTTYKRMKVILTGSIHGNEKLWPYVYYRVFHDMINRYKEDEILDFLRWNVDFIVMPIVNPSGFDDTTRNKRNGVNLNRNFEMNWEYSEEEYDASGPHPFSEIETQYVKQLIDENLDAEFLIDGHTFRGSNYFLWVPIASNNPDIDQITFLSDYFGWISREWKKRFEWMPQDEDRIFGRTTNLPVASLKTYGEQKGIKNLTMEMYEYIPHKPGYKDHDSDSIELAMEYFVNMLIGLIKTQ